MGANKETLTAIDSVGGVYVKHGEDEFKTNTDPAVNIKKDDKTVLNKFETWLKECVPSTLNFIVLAVLVLLVWGILWIAWGEGWQWNGPWLRMLLVACTAWTSGQVLQSITGFPPLLAALLTGILARNLGYLDMRQFPEIDMVLRKIYPMIILGKASLGWDLNFMKTNWKNIVSLGAVPWTLEVLTLATCMHLLFGHPWAWGILFGTFYASVSYPVVMPSVMRVGMSPNRSRNWPQFIAISSGTDVTLSVGAFGIIYSYMFVDVDDTYRSIKVALTPFVGVGLGIVWGRLAGALPKRDRYITELRILFVVLGGICANFTTMHLGWGGVAGVAVLATNAVAARYWARDGWKMNMNPASTAYRVLWAACEPTLFAYTGTFFEIKGSTYDTFLFGFAILAICLAVRLSAAALMCWGMSLRERLFICCCWTPKTIVESVLCPLPINTLIIKGGTENEIKYAEDILRLTIQAIVITTPIAFVLAKYLGPTLMKDKVKEINNDPVSKDI